IGCPSLLTPSTAAATSIFPSPYRPRHLINSFESGCSSSSPIILAFHLSYTLLLRFVANRTQRYVMPLKFNVIISLGMRRLTGSNFFVRLVLLFATAGPASAADLLPASRHFIEKY